MGSEIRPSVGLGIDVEVLTQKLAAGDHMDVHNYLHRYILWCCRRKAARHKRMTYPEIYSDLVFLLETKIEYARTLSYGALYLLRILSESAKWRERAPMHQLQDVPVTMPPDLPLEYILHLEPFEYAIVEGLVAGYTQRELAARYHIGTDEMCRRVAQIRIKVAKWRNQNL